MANPPQTIAAAAQKAIDDLNGRSIYTVRSTLIPMSKPDLSHTLNAIKTEMGLRFGQNLDRLDMSKLSLTPKQLSLAFHQSISMNDCNKEVLVEKFKNKPTKEVPLQVWGHRVFGNAIGEGMDLQTAMDQIWSEAPAWPNSKKAFYCAMMQAIVLLRECMTWKIRVPLLENLILVMINTGFDVRWFSDPTNDGLAYFNDISLGQWVFVADHIIKNSSTLESNRSPRRVLTVAEMEKLPWGLFSNDLASILPYRKKVAKTVARVADPVSQDETPTALPQSSPNNRTTATKLDRARQYLEPCIWKLAELERAFMTAQSANSKQEAKRRLEEELNGFEEEFCVHMLSMMETIEATTAANTKEREELHKVDMNIIQKVTSSPGKWKTSSENIVKLIGQITNRKAILAKLRKQAVRPDPEIDELCQQLADQIRRIEDFDRRNAKLRENAREIMISMHTRRAHLTEFVKSHNLEIVDGIDVKIVV